MLSFSPYEATVDGYSLNDKSLYAIPKLDLSETLHTGTGVPLIAIPSQTFYALLNDPNYS